MKKTILFLIVITTIACGCKKYEEGPCISFKSAKNRVYGYYTLTSLTVDGVDYLSQYSDSLSKKFAFIHEEVSSYGDFCHIEGGGGGELYWSWKLNEDNTILKIESSLAGSGGHSYGPFKTGVLPEWTILRLTKSEMKLKTTYENKEFVIFLEQ